MTTTERLKNTRGRDATAIPPIQCRDWCTDPRPRRRDWSRGPGLLLHRRLRHGLSRRSRGHQVWGVPVADRGHAYRGFNKYPVVLMHIEGFRNGLDEEARFTANEARQLAALLADRRRHDRGNRIDPPPA